LLAGELFLQLENASTSTASLMGRTFPRRPRRWRFPSDENATSEVTVVVPSGDADADVRGKRSCTGGNLSVVVVCRGVIARERDSPRQRLGRHFSAIGNLVTFPARPASLSTNQPTEDNVYGTLMPMALASAATAAEHPARRTSGVTVFAAFQLCFGVLMAVGSMFELTSLLVPSILPDAMRAVLASSPIHQVHHTEHIVWLWTVASNLAALGIGAGLFTAALGMFQRNVAALRLTRWLILAVLGMAVAGQLVMLTFIYPRMHGPVLAATIGAQFGFFGFPLFAHFFLRRASVTQQFRQVADRAREIEGSTR
jgi:hypothetical protein